MVGVALYPEAFQPFLFPVSGMNLPPKKSVNASGVTTKRPRNNESVFACIMPTNMGPVVAPRGNNVRVRPNATATSLGGRRMSSGIVDTIGGTAMEHIPDPISNRVAMGMEFVTRSPK